MFSQGLAEIVLIVGDVEQSARFYDPDGNLLEFWAPAPENITKEKL